LYAALFQAAQHATKRQLLHALYINGGTALYDGLEAVVNRSRRRIKSHVYDLDDAGIVTRSGNPVVVSFVDTDVALLASDTLHLTDPL
jgi:hypothetical protein